MEIYVQRREGGNTPSAGVGQEYNGKNRKQPGSRSYRRMVITAVVLAAAAASFLAYGRLRAVAAPDSDRVTVSFYGDDGETLLKQKTARYGRGVTIPEIRKSYLPEEYQDREDITPCWVIRDTEEAYYPEDDFWLEDYMEKDDLMDMDLVLVPDDSVLDYEKTDLFFYDSDGEEIEKYAKTDVKVGGAFKLPDPSPYGGSYWAYEDEDGNRKLVGGGTGFTATEYSTEFYACGNGTVSIVYRYPVDVDSLANDQEPGDIYGTANAKVGDYITLKHSPGSVVWGCTFRGWEDYSGQYDGLLQPGSVIQIVTEEDIEFVACYEEDENWDPDTEGGWDGGEDGSTAMNPDGLTNEYTMELEENAGAGVEVSLNNNPTNQSFGGLISKSGGTYTGFTQDAVKKTAQNGSITTTTKIDKTLTHEEEDQYGRTMDKGGDSTKPLIQDDSLFAMDIYGNAFVYPYWASTEAERIAIVTERLKQYKGNSWLNFISRHSELAEAVRRFEEREFSLLKDSCTDKLKIDRLQWRGWMDYYSDLPANIGNTEVNNIDGDTNRLLARIKFSSSWENIIFYPYYYDPSRAGSSTYGFDGLSSLSAGQRENLTVLYNTLIRAGYSESAACGACALAWLQTDGTFSPSYSGTDGVGLGGWDEGDADWLKGIAQETGEQWDSINTQSDLFVVWLDQNMGDINEKLESNTGMMIKELKKLGSETNAADVLCAAFLEGKEEKEDSALQLFDGLYYKDASMMREYAKKLKQALKKTENGYGFDLSGLDLANCSEARKRVVELACAQVGKQYVWGALGPNTFDCSGLTLWAYQNGTGIALPHKATLQINYGRKIPKTMLRPGDLIVWDGHVAMYIGGGKRVEAVGAKYGIQIRDLDADSGHPLLGYVSLLD